MNKQYLRNTTIAFALGVQWACGGGSGPSGPTAVATPTPAPTPQPPAVLLQGSFSLPAGFLVAFRTVNVPSSGVLDMTVDWTFARNDIDIAIVRGLCTEEMFNAETCDFIAFTDSETAKPEKLKASVTAGTYTPMAVNFGPDDESGAVQVVFTGGASPSSSSAARVLGPKAPVRFMPAR